MNGTTNPVTPTMSKTQRHQEQIGSYTIDNVLGRTKDTTNQSTYTYAVAEDGTRVHYVGDTLLHEDAGYSAVDLSREEIASEITNRLAQWNADTMPDQYSEGYAIDYAYIVANADEIADTLATAWELRAEEEMEFVERVGVHRDGLFTESMEPWLHEVDEVEREHDISSPIVRDVMTDVLSEVVRSEAKWYYPHAEYIVTFDDD